MFTNRILKLAQKPRSEFSGNTIWGVPGIKPLFISLFPIWGFIADGSKKRWKDNILKTWHIRKYPRGTSWVTILPERRKSFTNIKSFLLGKDIKICWKALPCFPFKDLKEEFFKKNCRKAHKSCLFDERIQFLLHYKFSKAISYLILGGLVVLC